VIVRTGAQGRQRLARIEEMHANLDAV